MSGVTSETVWFLTLSIAIVTFGFRYSFIALFGRVDEVPNRVEQALEYVPSAVLAALVVPPLLAPNETISVGLGNEQLLAGIVAALVAWRTQSMLATILTGMGVLWLLSAVLG